MEGNWGITQDGAKGGTKLSNVGTGEGGHVGTGGGGNAGSGRRGMGVGSP